MKTLILYKVDDARLRKIRDAVPGIQLVTAGSQKEAEERIAEAEVVFALPPPLVEIFSKARDVRWVHSGSAGMDVFLFPALVESDVLLTNSRGYASIQAAEHAFGLVLALTRGINAAIRRQATRQYVADWDPESGHTSIVHMSELQGQTLGIIGLGNIGQRVAWLGHSLGMKVIAYDPYRRDRPEYVEELLGVSGLSSLLSRTDIVMLAAPQTPETEKMIAESQLALMKPTAYIVNVGRGKLIDQGALVKALQEGRIAGAGLDVFEEEPVPPESPLWDLTNVVMTSHSASTSQHREDRIIGIFIENLQRYREGRALINIVDKKRGF